MSKIRYPSLVLVCSTLLFAPLAPATASGNGQDRDEDSVYSWGRWEVLAPAAGAAPAASVPQLQSAVQLRAGDSAALTPEFQSVNPPRGEVEPKPPVTDIDPQIPLQNDQPTRRTAPF